MQHTAVMLCSLFETNPTKEFSVFLITDTYSYLRINQQHGDVHSDTCRLQELCGNYGHKLYIIQCSLSEIEDLPIGQWSTFMYLKLFMPRVLPEKVDRCLFLDVDMVINADIVELYQIDLYGRIIAAVEDIPDCLAHKSRLGLSENDLYINSGVMVCDIAKWRNMQKSTDIFDFTRRVVQTIMNEQDVIALYFKGLIKVLPIKWNMVTFYFLQTPKIFDKYLPQLKEARRKPCIIHFAAPIKPWFSDCSHPYGCLYRKYLAKTPWKCAKFDRYEQLSLHQRLKKRVKRGLLFLGVIKDPFYLTTRV